eukprot:COSAG06_NODE_39376_length_413_cov_0.974522_1_plen_131_part_00
MPSAAAGSQQRLDATSATLLDRGSLGGLAARGSHSAFFMPSVWQVDEGGAIGFRNSPDLKDAADPKETPPAKPLTKWEAIEEKSSDGDDSDKAGWIKARCGTRLFLRRFCSENDHFAKMGSGQTWENTPS